MTKSKTAGDDFGLLRSPLKSGVDRDFVRIPRAAKIAQNWSIWIHAKETVKTVRKGLKLIFFEKTEKTD